MPLQFGLVGIGGTTSNLAKSYLVFSVQKGECDLPLRLGLLEIGVVRFGFGIGRSILAGFYCAD